MADSADQSDLAGAHGKFVVFLASLLQRAGVVEAGEFATLLDLFAQTVRESNPGEGAILAAWANAAGEVGRTSH